MNLLFKIIILAFLALLGACCPKIVPVSTNTIVTVDSSVFIHYRDSLLKIPAKVITTKKYVNCDSLGKAQLKKQTTKKDGLTQQVEIKDGKLIATCQADSLKLLLKLKETQISLLKNKETITIQTIEVYKLHWWEQYEIYGFWTFIVLGILSGAYFVLKSRINFKF